MKHLSPEALGAWAVRNMLPGDEEGRAAGIAARVAAIVRAEREAEMVRDLKEAAE